MTYLFGDSTPSPLATNFIDFLRDALECCARVLTVAEHLREAKQKAQDLEKAHQAEAERLGKLGQIVARAVEEAPLCEPNSPTMRCAEAIVRSSAELVRGETDKARALLQTELARLEAQASGEREAGAQALAALLLKHELPDAKTELRLGQQPGARYSARQRLVSATGLEALLELEIAPGHLLAHVLQVHRLMERLDVQVPEARKDKLRAQRLDKEYVTELYVGDKETTLKLRASAEGGAGFDLTIPAGGRVTITRVGDGDSAPFELGEGDVPRILELRDKLTAACRELLPHKRAVIDARLDGVPLKDHANPRLLVERLIAALSPVAQEIAKRSLTPTELVLKRQLGDGRREEIFVTKDELRQKIASLAPPLRALFAPLGFSNGAAAPPEKEPEEPTLLEKSLPDVKFDDWPDVPPPPPRRS